MASFTSSDPLAPEGRPPTILARRSIDEARWLDLVRRDPAATAFHHPAWASAVAASYGFETFLVTVEDGDRLDAALPMIEVRGVLRPSRWVSLPFTDTCGPLGNSDAVAELAGALEQERLLRGIDTVEIRARLPLPSARHVDYLTHVVPLGRDFDAVERRYSQSLRRHLRRGSRAGLHVRIGETENDLTRVFYDLHVLTRRRLGLPVQPRRFFRLLWRGLSGAELCRVVLVELDGCAVAGAVFLTWNSHLIYKYAASDVRYWGLRPNHLLLAETVRWGCASGYSKLDLGRTAIDGSLRRFKQGWGGEELPLTYTILGDGRGSHDGEPPRIVRAALRHSPKWLVRAAGEVVYRRAA